MADFRDAASIVQELDGIAPDPEAVPLALLPSVLRTAATTATAARDWIAANHSEKSPMNTEDRDSIKASITRLKTRYDQLRARVDLEIRQGADRIKADAR